MNPSDFLAPAQWLLAVLTTPGPGGVILLLSVGVACCAYWHYRQAEIANSKDAKIQELFEKIESILTAQNDDAEKRLVKITDTRDDVAALRTDVAAMKAIQNRIG